LQGQAVPEGICSSLLALPFCVASQLCLICNILALSTLLSSIPSPLTASHLPYTPLPPALFQVDSKIFTLFPLLFPVTPSIFSFFALIFSIGAILPFPSFLPGLSLFLSLTLLKSERICLTYPN